MINAESMEREGVIIMCMYLTNANYLGTRLIGYEAYESKTRGFVGFSEKQAIDRLGHGDRIYGFRIKEDETGKEILELDEEGFNMTNLQVKSGVNNLGWLKEMDGDMNIGLIVVSVTGDRKKMYETVNARHARVAYDEGRIRMMMELGIPVAGVRLEKNKIVACEGVETVNVEKEENE